MLTTALEMETTSPGLEMETTSPGLEMETTSPGLEMETTELLMLHAAELMKPGCGRRDSGYSPTKEDSDSPVSSCKRLDGLEGQDSGDSGVGSPSPHATGGVGSSSPHASGGVSSPSPHSACGVGSPSPHATGSRCWGRQCSRRSELRRLQEIQAELRELVSGHGGEVFFHYKPRVHPNLPSISLKETRLLIPSKEVGRQDRGARVTLHPGYFLQRTGLTRSDILEVRLPDIPSGGLAVVSNGLAIDLFRLSQSNPVFGPAIAKFIFHFLELSFPLTLLESAVELTLRYIRENLEYVETCTNADEMENFLYSPFIVPEQVAEMATILEDWDEELEEGSSQLSPAFRDSTEEDLYLHNKLVCGINIVNKDGGLETYEISSVQDLSDHTAGFIQEQSSCTWSMDQQSDLNLVGCAEDVYPVTATLINLVTGDQQLVHPEQEEWLNSEQEKMGVRLDSDQRSHEESPRAGSEDGSSRKRSQTREVQIPSRFKDYDTMTPSKRGK